MTAGLRTVGRSRLTGALLLALVAAASTACEKSQLLAPTGSTITLSAGTRILPPNGSTQVSAFVSESSGTPVHNGTTVRFTTTLGTLDPAEAQTVNGVATTTFRAGLDSGVAEIRATSGGATGGTGSTGTGGGTGTGGTSSAANVVTITIGAAAVNTVTLRANPGNVGANGGTVELIATVVAENGRPLEGILVTFNADRGTLSSPTATTNSLGEARTTLTTTEQTNVTATAGTKTSTPATQINVRTGPGVTITCAPASGTGNCAAVQANTSSNTATVVFTISKASGTSNLRTATIDFGDGTSQSLGNLAGTATVTHTYNGPSGSSPANYTATVLATDVNGESTSASTTVNVTPRATPTPINVTLAATADTATTTGQRWTFTATVTGGGEGTANAPIESYTWDFGDGTSATTSGNTVAHVYTSNGVRTVRVTVRAQDGRTATAQTEIQVRLATS